MKDVSKLWSAGYALGASLENTLVVSDERVLNPEGTRFADEFVRHKALDAIGDLALAGAPILGAYRSVRGGHKLNHAVLSALIADPSAWTVVEARTPRPRGHAEVPPLHRPTEPTFLTPAAEGARCTTRPWLTQPAHSRPNVGLSAGPHGEKRQGLG